MWAVCLFPMQVYATRRRQDNRSSLRDSANGRGRGEGGAAIGQPRSPAWKRSPSAEAIAEATKGWHGQGTLDARSKCFTDEHAFVVGEGAAAHTYTYAKSKDIGGGVAGADACACMQSACLCASRDVLGFVVGCLCIQLYCPRLHSPQL